MDNNVHKQLWIYACWASLTLSLVGISIVAVLNGSNQVTLAANIAFILTVVSLIGFVVLFVASWMIKGRAKTLPLVGMPILLVVAALAYFAHRLGGI